MTFMASYNQCMTQLMAKFHPKYCVFGAGFQFLKCYLLVFVVLELVSSFSVILGLILHLLVGGPASVKTFQLASWGLRSWKSWQLILALLKLRVLKEIYSWTHIFSTFWASCLDKNLELLLQKFCIVNIRMTDVTQFGNWSLKLSLKSFNGHFMMSCDSVTDQ